MGENWKNKVTRHREDSGNDTARGGKRFPFGWLWLVFTVIVLVVVLMYDRRAVHTAQDHITQGKSLETNGLYVDAIEEYEKALDNKRLGRKAKAGAAVALAEIYYNHLNDFQQAHKYYVQARQASPGSVEDKLIKEHAKLAAIKAQQSGVFVTRKVNTPGVTTQTVIQQVELVRPPAADEKGPVLVTYNGGEIRAGQLLRALAKRPEFLRPDFREDPEKLRGFLEGIIRDDLAYQAAVSANVHKDPDVSERLYDYQKTLVTQRYQVDRRVQALVVENPDVEKYYQENLGQYVQPGSIKLSVIAADSEASSTELLALLKEGNRFEDVASSYSTHRESASKGGALSDLTDKDTTLPGVGEAPELINSLFKLPLHSVTEVTPVADKFYIFKITEIRPARKVTLDEARPQIENILRGRLVDKARTGLEEELQKNFEPSVNKKNLEAFWDFVQQETALADMSSTTTTTAKPVDVSSTQTSESVTSSDK